MDRKAYPYRGFMLDAARHFMPAADVCRVIEAAAACGMNRMHWHLTDDQGWRLEIKKFPLLTKVGAYRGPSYFGGPFSETENNCGYYTQQDVRDIVAFAGEKGIEIVPEIEVPGHASAMLAAYPEFGCRRVLPRIGREEIEEQPYRYQVMTYAGVFPNLICAGKESAVRFLKDILDEVMELFPGPEVHIGGDEAVKMHWRRCPDCQKRMAAEGLRDERALQRSLVLEIGAYLAEKGKKTIVWNESLEGGGLPPHFIVQHWLGNKEETKAFMAGGGQVICSDVAYYYVNRPYSSIDAYGIWKAPLVPDYAEGQEENLLGLECTLWAERVTNVERAAYLLFPRAAAVAMKALGQDDYPDWESYKTALREKMRPAEALGLTPAPEEVWRMEKDAAEEEKRAEERGRHAPRMEEVFRVNDGMLMQEELEKLLHDTHMP
ncbi:MAG: family 20 glycosylhydrolase, partial [Clostridia bacterium]|nr:family 20 glycosylhydrolase [Clostridia bacterium]